MKDRRSPEGQRRSSGKRALLHDIINRLDEIAAMVPHRPWKETIILPSAKNYVGPGIANMGAAVQVGGLQLKNPSASIIFSLSISS